MPYSVRPDSVNNTIYKNQKIPVGAFVKIRPCARTVENDLGGRLDLFYCLFYLVQ